MKEIYLDEFASARVGRNVLKVMEKHYKEDYANPSSVHGAGEKAFGVIRDCKREIAKEINSKSGEIYFTSGATESNNLAIQGLSRANPKRRTIVISAIEHPSVYETAEYMKSKGYNVIKIGVDLAGKINLEEFEKEILKNKKDILLVSVMYVNNIIGFVQDLKKIGDICRKNNVLFHTDAVQGFGKLKIDVKEMKIDLLSASGHKIGGPKGIGLLYVRDGVKIKPLLLGGGQEKGLRSGTENIPAIAGFSKALEEIKKLNNEEIKKTRNNLALNLEKIGGKINNDIERSMYNILHVSFPGIEGRKIVNRLSDEGIYISSGSACESKKAKTDYVLKSIGLNKKEIDGALRISLEKAMKDKEISFVIDRLKKALGGWMSHQNRFK